MILISLCGPVFAVDAEQQVLQKLFHLAGIPGLNREERVDLVPNTEGLSFQTKKVQYQVSYGRIRQVLIIQADRRYEGATYAAALATFGVGSLFILKKHHVDTIVLDYVNERGGKMGIVVQMDPDQGEVFETLMTSRNISVVKPKGVPESQATGASSTAVSEGSTK